METDLKAQKFQLRIFDHGNHYHIVYSNTTNNKEKHTRARLFSGYLEQRT